MSSSLGRNSNVRKSFRLEITLEKSYVETSRSPDSVDDTLKLDSPSSPVKREFVSTRNWNSDPKLLSKEQTTIVTTKASSSGNLTRSKTQTHAKKDKKQSENTMNYAGSSSGSDTPQKSKPGPVSRLKTVIRSTKETIVERLPGSSKESPKRVSRSRPKSVDASQRFGVHNNGRLNQREPSLSPPSQRRSNAKVDRSRSFNVKSRVNIDGFVAKRCEVWERKSRDSSPNRSTVLPVDLPSSEIDKKSLIKQRTAMLLDSKTPDNTLPSKKQLLLDLNGRTASKSTSKNVPQKPQLKPKRINLFKRGQPVKPKEAHASASDREPPLVSNSSHSSVEVVTKNQVEMGKNCSVHQEGSVIEEDYGIDALKAGYDPHPKLNGVTPSPTHQRKEKLGDKRSGKDEKENQSAVLPNTLNQRTTSYSTKTSDSVQSNGPLPTCRVLTERLDENLLNCNLTENPEEKIVVKHQTVATLNGVRLLDESFEIKDDGVDKKSLLLTSNLKMVDDVFESPEDNKEETATVNGVVLTEKEQEKNGFYFLDVTNRTQEELENLSKRAEQDLESDIPEEASGKLRAAIGKTNLLTTKKFKQFRGLCDENNHPREGSKTPTSEDLAGFWDMVMIQVDDVKAMFEEIEAMRRNGWQSPKRASQVKPVHIHEECDDFIQPVGECETSTILSEAKTPTRRPKAKTRPKATTPNAKSSLKETERAAKAKQQREEARRRLLAAKKAMRRRTLSGSISDEGGVEIYC